MEPEGQGIRSGGDPRHVCSRYGAGACQTAALRSRVVAGQAPARPDTVEAGQTCSSITPRTASRPRRPSITSQDNITGLLLVAHQRHR